MLISIHGKPAVDVLPPAPKGITGREWLLAVLLIRTPAIMFALAVLVYAFR